MNQSMVIRKIWYVYNGDHELSWLEKYSVIMKLCHQLSSLLIEKMYHMSRQLKCSQKGAALSINCHALPVGNLTVHLGELIVQGSGFCCMLLAAMATFSGRQMQGKLMF